MFLGSVMVCVPPVGVIVFLGGIVVCVSRWCNVCVLWWCNGLWSVV